MSSIKNIFFYALLSLFMVSCSLTPVQKDLGQSSRNSIDFEALHKKAQAVSARTNDLKKYKAHKVSF